MNLKFGWKTTALALSSIAIAIGLTACGGSEQSNSPLKNSAVELVSSSLQYDSAGTTISGTITTKYALTGTATLSGISAKINDCNISTTSVGTGNVITYADSNNTVSNVVITLVSQCAASSVTFSGNEKNDNNVTWPWEKSTNVTAAPSADITSPIASLNPDSSSSNIVLTQNSEQREIVLNVFDSNNAPVTEGVISVRYPDELINGSDVGSLSPVVEAAVVDGKVKFLYTGPSDLNTLVNSGVTSVVFTFFDKQNPARTADTTVNFNPDPGQIIQTKYFITSSIDDENVTMDLNDTRVMGFFLKDKEGNTVADADIASMKITILNPLLADLIDSEGAVAKTFTKTTNNVTISLKSYTKSGLVPIEVVIDYTDVNGVAQTISRIVSVVILSGPPTAFSMKYANTGQDEDIAKFIEHIVISANDEYGNVVNTQPSVSVGIISGYARDEASGVGNRYAVSLTPIVNDVSQGVATIANPGSGAEMTAPNISTTAIDMANDKLATFGIGYTYHASGKWDMLSVAGDVVSLNDDYALAPEDKMGYVIGHNHRQEICDNTGKEALAYLSSHDGLYKLDPSGNAVIDVYYDYYLVAKTVAIYANFVGQVNEIGESVRVGETMIHNLRGHGIEYEDSFEMPDGASGMGIEFGPVHVIDTPVFLKNSYFSYTFKGTGDVQLDYNITSMDLPYSDPAFGGNGGTGIYSCEEEGKTFVYVIVSDAVPGNDKGGTVSVTVKNVIHGEF